MPKRKQILHLADDEMAVVLPVDYWKHFVSVYEALAEDCTSAEEKQSWLDVAGYVKSAIEQNIVEDWYED